MMRDACEVCGRDIRKGDRLCNEDLVRLYFYTKEAALIEPNQEAQFTAKPVLASV